MELYLFSAILFGGLSALVAKSRGLDITLSVLGGVFLGLIGFIAVCVWPVDKK